MKKTVLVLLAPLSLLAGAQLLAPTTAPVPPDPPATPAPDDSEVPATPAAPRALGAWGFGAPLSGGRAQARSAVVPAPSFLASSPSPAGGPRGQLCCNVCGNPPLSGGTCRACVTPVRGRCPLIV